MSNTAQRPSPGLDELGQHLAGNDDASPVSPPTGIKITIAVENVDDDREDPPVVPPPEPTTVVRPVRGDDDQIEFAVPKVRLTGGSKPRLVFAITLES
ncbi:MAG: hypothetical protein SF066_09180 [Thermoanaerobaculia bacterium]|nr:hypothetical protein [Thermoanaerobaculia bacterium]